MRNRLSEVTAESEKPELWDNQRFFESCRQTFNYSKWKKNVGRNPTLAQDVLQEQSRLEKQLSIIDRDIHIQISFHNLETECETQKELLELGVEENDLDVVLPIEKRLETLLLFFFKIFLCTYKYLNIFLFNGKRCGESFGRTRNDSVWAPFQRLWWTAKIEFDYSIFHTKTNSHSFFFLTKLCSMTRVGVSSTCGAAQVATKPFSVSDPTKSNFQIKKRIRRKSGTGVRLGRGFVRYLQELGRQ